MHGEKREAVRQTERHMVNTLEKTLNSDSVSSQLSHDKSKYMVFPTSFDTHVLPAALLPHSFIQ